MANLSSSQHGKTEAEMTDVNWGTMDQNDTIEHAKEFKEGGFGWLVVFAIFLLNAHTWGLNSTFAVFLAYYLRTGTFHGGSPIGYAFVGGLSMSLALLISPLGTAMVGFRRLGTRWTIIAGVVLQTVAFVGASFTSQLWHLLLTQGVSFGFGMGLCFVASVGVIPQWFTKRRSFANAVAASGSGFGGLCYSLACNAMISSIGLPFTFRVLAIITFVVNGTCGFLIRDRNQEVGAVHVAFDLRLLKRPSFLLFLLWLSFSLFGYVILIFSLPDYCQAIGLTASQGSLVGAMFNLSQGLGRPIIGLASDTVGRINIASFCTLFTGLCTLFVWIFGAKTFAGCIIFAVVSGGTAGVMWATAGPVGAEVVGISILPSALSITWVILVLPSTFSEVIGLTLRQSGATGYLHTQLFTGFMYIAAFTSAWALRAWKIDEIKGAHNSNASRGRAIRDDGIVPFSSASAETSNDYQVKIQTRSRLMGMWAIERV